IFAGALMSFTLSLDNTILSSFVQLPGSTPWPVYIFAAVKVALRPEIAAVSTLMFLLTLVALGVCALALRRTGGSSTEIIKTMAGCGSRRKRHVPSWAVPSSDRCADRPRGRKRYDMDVQTALAEASTVPFWLDTDERPSPLPPLTEDLDAELLIVGGGFTGL